MSLKVALSKQLPHGQFWTHSRTIIEGCTPCSPGCGDSTGGGCWLESIYRRNLPGMAHNVIDRATKRFNGTVIERPDRLDVAPKRFGRKHRVWTYWSDAFHPGVSIDFQGNLFREFYSQDYHIICTKRPDKVVEFLRNWPHRPLFNVIILVTMEDQQRVQERWKHSVQIACRGWKVGLLLEPLLSAIQLDPSWLNLMSWVITGGESGSKARISRGDWFRSLRDQAQAAGVPFLFKGWGEWKTVDHVQILTGKFKDDYAVRLGKKRSGRLLDGREWNEVPNI